MDCNLQKITLQPLFYTKLFYSIIDYSSYFTNLENKSINIPINILTAIHMKVILASILPLFQYFVLICNPSIKSIPGIR